MTQRAKAFMWCAIAYGFVYTANEDGIKGFKRAETCLLAVMDKLRERLSDKQVEQAIDEGKRTVDKMFGEKMEVYDFMDAIVNAMEIIKNGKERYLNSMLALAGVNVPEEI